MVDHVKLQREAPTAFHLASMFARLDRAGTFTSHAMTLGGRIARNDIIGDAGRRRRRVHARTACTWPTATRSSTRTRPSITRCRTARATSSTRASWPASARAVFNGKIIVRQDAQKTNAKQTNKALLLSDDAQINTKPQLEIFADDVKCTHGAAIGQLDEDALFYLQARGIGEDDARNLLIHAFAGDVLDGVKEDVVRERAMRLLEEKLHRYGRVIARQSRGACVRRRRHARGVPGAAAAGARQAAGVSRQRGDHAEAAAVIDAFAHYYEHDNANVHRGVHALSERATAAYEGARENVRAFINARVGARDHLHPQRHREHQPGRARVGRCATSRRATRCSSPAMEHHSNIVPWQLLCERTGATLKVVPIDDRGDLVMEEFERLLTPTTKMVAVVHLSNALGTRQSGGRDRRGARRPRARRC